ncbi:hypothetical protein D3C85_253520 [compost metagenome]
MELQVDQRRVARHTALAADGGIDIDRHGGVFDRDGAAHGLGVSAVAAAAANGLRHHAVRALAVGLDRAGAGQRHIHFAAVAARAARSAYGHRRSNRERGAVGNRRFQRDALRCHAASVAAAAADRLRKNAVGIRLVDRLGAGRGRRPAVGQAGCADAGVVQRHADLVRTASQAGAAAYRDPQAESQVHIQRLGGAAAAAAAADRLGDDARRAGAVGRQGRPRGLDGHRIGPSAAAAGPANRQGHGIQHTQLRRRAAAASAAADRLGEQPRRSIAHGTQHAVVVDGHEDHATRASRPRAAAQGRNRRRGADAKCITAVAAPTSDRLRDRAVGIPARRLLRAVRVYRHRVAVAAGTAGAPDGQQARRRRGAAAAAADRLAEQADGRVALGTDQTRIGHGDPAAAVVLRGGHRSANGDQAASGARRAAAAADGLAGHAGGPIAVGPDAARVGDRHRAAAAAGAAVSPKRQEQPRTDAASAAAAADRLRQQAIGMLSRGADGPRGGDRGVRARSAIAAVATRPGQAIGEVGARASAPADRLRHDTGGKVADGGDGRVVQGGRERGPGILADAALRGARAAKSADALRQEAIGREAVGRHRRGLGGRAARVIQRDADIAGVPAVTAIRTMVGGVALAAVAAA